MSVSYRTHTFLTVLAAWIFYCISDSLAQNSSATNPVYLMEEIVVTDTVRTSASEVSISKDRLRIQRASSAAEMLADIPGSLVTVGSKNSSEIMIRGFDSDEVLVMVDGRPVNEPYYGKIDLSTIGVGNVAKIKVVKGATSVRYGPNAMGGVVNIMTGDDDGPPVDVRLSAGSGKEIRADVITRGFSHGIGYRIHIGRVTTHGFPLSSDFKPTFLENGSMRDNSDYNRTDLDAKLLFGPRDNPDWRLSIGGSHLAKGLPSSVHEARFWRFRNWDRMSMDLDGEPVKKDSFRLKTKFYVDRFLNELVDYRDDHYDLTNIFYDSTHDNRSAGLLLSSSYIPGVNGITNFGMQVRLDESRRQADKGMDWFLNRTATSWVFAEHERTLRPNLFIRGGLSGALFSYKSWTKSTASINPSLYIEWTVRKTTLTGSVSRASRFPTLNQLFSSTSGNPDLKPEWVYKGELSVSRTVFGALHCTLTGFTNRVHDMIDRSGKLNKYHNITNASLDGVEFGGLITKKSFELYSVYTMLDSRDGNGEELDYRPRWKVDLYLTWRMFEHVRLYLSSRSVGQRRTEINTYLDPYHVQDAGLIFFEKHNISASIRLRNIFDINNEEEYGYPMAGRTILTGIDWQWGGR